MYTEIAWLDDDELGLGALATPRPEPPAPDGFICGDHLLGLARLEFGTLIKLFGCARDVMLKRFLPLCDWLDLDCWLSHLEKLTRCGLMMLALRVANPRGAAHPSRPPARRERSAAAGKAKTRSRGFVVLQPRSETSGESKHTAKDRAAADEERRAKAGLEETLPLAMRIEALLCVLNEPAKFVRRLAKKLERMKRPHKMPKARPPRDEFDRSLRASASRLAIMRVKQIWPQLQRDCASYFAPS